MDKKFDKSIIPDLKSKVALNNFLNARVDQLNIQDDQGESILHHAANLGLSLPANEVISNLNLIFNQEGLDFNLKDRNLRTPLHTAAYACKGSKVTCTTVFPLFVEQATKANFDFSALDNTGKSILHLAAMYSYTDSSTKKRFNNVETLINNVPNLDLNVLSSSNATALYYAICNFHFEEAHYLLDNGADPRIGTEFTKSTYALTIIRRTISDLQIEPHENQKLLLEIEGLEKKIDLKIAALNKAQPMSNTVTNDHKNSLLSMKSEGKLREHKDLLKILNNYSINRKSNPKEYFHPFWLVSGYSKIEKLAAVNELMEAIKDNSKSITPETLKICQQGRLGKLVAKWEKDNNKQITDIVTVTAPVTKKPQ